MMKLKFASFRNSEKNGSGMTRADYCNQIFGWRV